MAETKKPDEPTGKHTGKGEPDEQEANPELYAEMQARGLREPDKD